jgi:exonuclease III
MIAVRDMFYMKLSSLLDDLATLAEPVFVAGDFDIRLHRPDDTNTQRLSEMFEAHGLTCQLAALQMIATEHWMWLQRAVIWQHQLLLPSLMLATPTTDWFAGRVILRNRRQCTRHRRVDVSAFQAALRSSALCSIVNDSVTTTLNNSLRCMIARSMPLRIVLCHPSL